jgi:hypothetical protein
MSREKAEWIAEQAFRVLPILEARNIPLATICLPVLGAGSQGLPAEKLVPAIIKGAKWALENLNSTRCVYFVDNDKNRYEKLKNVMDQTLERARLTLPRSPRADDIRKSFDEWPNRFVKSDAHLAATLANLRTALRSDSSAPAIAHAARLIREHLLKQILSNKSVKLSHDNLYHELKKRRVAEWIISYLNVLRIFSNDQLHEQDETRFPPRVFAEDLFVCLLTIDRILEFWFEFAPKLRSSF